MDSGRIERAIREVLLAIGDDPDRDGLRETPERVARMYEEIAGGLQQDAVEILSTQFDEAHQEMVIIRDVPFYSMCEHHLLPFFGTAHVGYIPRGKVVGISKLARAVDVFAKRPQVQERLTSQIADAIMEALDPEGVAVVMRAEHLCMSMRGVRKPGTSVVTSATRGEFRASVATRTEFLTLLQEGHC
ncbi:MAG: GTP cyclohydrolase I FolE [Dehalococcoidia bacterium]